MGIFANLFKKRNKESAEPKTETKQTIESSVSIEKTIIEEPVKPVLQYEHNGMKVSPPKTFTDNSGQRWIAKYRYHDVHLKRTTDFQELFPYDYLDVAMSDDDTAVFTFYGNEIGKISKTQKSAMIKDFINRNELIKAQVQSIEEKIFLRLYFYKRREDVIMPQEPIIVTLTGNSNDDMQCNIESCSVGDSISLEYDFDKDKFLVDASGYEIGYVPKSKHETIYDLENEGYEFSGQVISITEKDSGKMSIKVEIIAQ